MNAAERLRRHARIGVNLILTNLPE